MAVYHFHNDYHIGDCILSLRFFYSIANNLKEKNILIKFYYNESYIKEYVKELKCYTVSGIIELYPTSIKPSESRHLWMGLPIDGTRYHDWSIYFELQYKNISKILSLNLADINCSLWLSEEYLLDNYTKLTESCKDIDILIINSAACSGQYTRDRSDMDTLCRYFDTSYNIITTRKVDNIKCTLDYDLRIQDIAAIATHAKYVIAIFTGPVCGLFNIQTKSVIKKWFFIKSYNEPCNISDLNYHTIYNGNLTPIYDYFKAIRH